MKHVLFFIFFFPGFLFSQVPCENGFAGIYPCNNVDLLSQVPLSVFGAASTNEVWGWTDPMDGTEYVLLGASNGTIFFDITDPVNPLYLGRLPTATFNSLWRTLRVYDHYLFVSSEANNHGLQVFDLYRLRNIVNPPQLFSEDAHYSGFGKCHTLAIEPETGFLYACGTNTFSGGLHIVNIQDPLHPVLAGAYSLDGYTHEAQVLVYNGPDTDYTGHTVAFCYNGNNPANLTIVDVTDPTDTETISITFYPNSAYCHQGWLTPDGNYLLMDDELDENSGYFNKTRTMIWDVHDLDAPHFMGNHFGSTGAIDHNQIIIGNISYQSNYTAGLRLIDISEIADTSLNEIAYFDHYPTNNNLGFYGEWMSYPYFTSGVIPVSDMYSGMFLLKPNFIHISGNGQSTCFDDTAHFEVILSEGFLGPVLLQANGLPQGVVCTFEAQSVFPPDTVGVEIAGLNSLSGNYSFDLSATGEWNEYKRTINFNVLPPLTAYPDNDGDGAGVQGNTIEVCSLPSGYSMTNDDCDDNNPLIYPGAPGTSEGIDNNCDGIVGGAENQFCGDVDGDGLVTVIDIILCSGDLGCTVSCIADINADGSVTVADLMIVLADFGEICE
ncbi:MAG: choice-of-anchor B family protein [Crocinitomicaceae bacterium]|nr:choice-of-anchor B family protein [Crocinitomicaceae bacterium]